MHTNLPPQFADYIQSNSTFDITGSSIDDPLLLDYTEVRGRMVQTKYAPFDYINPGAQIAIVGMTPGAFQGNQALLAAHQALSRGASLNEASRLAKVHASFSGEPMRTNLVRMMDAVGIAALLGLKTTETLWGENSKLIHFTSALRYPTFVDGKNWSGNPDVVKTPKLREWLVKWTGAELAEMKSCLIVPLGPKVSAAMNHLADVGLIARERIMDGMPHPSGASQERVNCFLGLKRPEDCSAKTNPQKLLSAKSALIKRAQTAQSRI